MTVTIGACRNTTILAFLPFLLCECASEDAANFGLEGTTSTSTGTTGGETTPTTGSVLPEVMTTDEMASTSEPGTSTGSASTGSELLGCGNGVVEGDEQCDAGFAENILSGACLPTCVLASCGDGFVQAGVEECDHGENNEFKYGGCVPATCKWGPRCGDGEVDSPDEVCDPGDPNGQGDEIAPCDASCRFEGRIVFLTSDTYDGNLGGLAGADSRCRDLAATFDAMRADSYIAWLSDSKSSPLDRVDHGPEFDATPYVLRSGVQVATNFEDLIDNGPWPGIDLTDKYESVLEKYVWTNTAIDGGLFSPEHHCEDWGSDSSLYGARIGQSSLPADSPDLEEWQKFGHWTSWVAASCEYKYRLYCFEN